MKNRHIGSNLNDFLDEEGMLVDSELTAIKRIIAMELERTLGDKKKHLTKTALAHKIGTSRAAVNRLLDSKNTSVTLHTLDKAARAIGKKLHFSLS